MINKGRDERILIWDQEGVELLGTNLKQVRKKLGFTQEDLAYKAGIAVSQVSRIENGQINATVSTMFRIARTLEVSVSELFPFKLGPLKQ